MTGSVDQLIDTVATTASRAARVQKVRSSAGVEAWLVEDYAVPLVAVNFGWKGGASQDPLGKPGVATLLSAVLDEGAGDLDSAAFHQALDDKAIELSFSADRDAIQGRLKTLSKHADRAFELLALAVTQARLDPEAIERVRSQLAASLRNETNDPDHAAARLFRQHSYPEHPYGQPVKGDLDILPTMTRDDLLTMRGRLLARDNLKVAVVGAIDAATLGRHLDAVFAPLPEKSDRTPVATMIFKGAGSRHTRLIELPQSTIRFGRQGIMRDDPDFTAATVANHCLGGSAFTARLYKEVREKRGLCYSVYSQNAELDHAAMFLGATSTKNARVTEAIDTIRDEIRKMSADGIPEEELDKARKYLVGSYALRFDTSRKIAGQLLSLQLDGYDVDRLDTRNEKIAAVTVEDAARAARRLLGDGELLITIAGKPVEG